MNKSDLPLVEKYRPNNLDEIVGHHDNILRLKTIAERRNMPNLMLVGSPGTGKTTSILCLAQTLIGSNLKEGLLELNASNDRGVEVIQSTVKNFAQGLVQLPPGIHKIIFFDEIDSMTAGAQQAMKNIMESCHNTTRFAFACNYSNKVIDVIQSRCAILNYAKLYDRDILNHLHNICLIEKIPYVMGGLEAIVFTANGDLRRALNNLQVLKSNLPTQCNL
jgi:replication factor C subunit 2/4